MGCWKGGLFVLGGGGGTRMVLGGLVVLFSVFEDYFQGKQCRPVLVGIVRLESKLGWSLGNYVTLVLDMLECGTGVLIGVCFLLCVGTQSVPRHNAMSGCWPLGQSYMFQAGEAPVFMAQGIGKSQVCLERGRESSIPCSCHFGLELVPPRRSHFGHRTFRTFDLQGFPVRSLHSNNLCPNI